MSSDIDLSLRPLQTRTDKRGGVLTCRFSPSSPSSDSSPLAHTLSTLRVTMPSSPEMRVSWFESSQSSCHHTTPSRTVSGLHRHTHIHVISRALPEAETLEY
jgi:hypothetical protein